MDPEKMRPLTTKELARIYNVSVRTFRRYIARKREVIGAPELGRCFSIKQVSIIFDHLGTP